VEACVAEQPSLSATTEVYTMKGETKEIWQQFCEQAAVEQNPDKLLALVKEINRMLEEKENRLLRARDRSAGQ
jgi:hypothetical protein